MTWTHMEYKISISYRNWYQYWGHCCLINDLGSSPQPEGEALGLWWASQVVNETCLINDLGSSPQPEGEALGLWWASQVVNETTMTEIEVSISILSWWNQINAE